MFQQQQGFVREEMSRYERLTNEIKALKNSLQTLPLAELPAPEIPFAEVLPPERVMVPQPQPAAAVAGRRPPAAPLAPVAHYGSWIAPAQ